MNRTSHYLYAVVLGASALTATLGGCELIATVDRSKLQGNGGAGGTGSTTDSTTSTTDTTSSTTDTTSSTSSTTSSTSTGTTCSDPQTDCPATGTACATPVCDQGVCSTTKAQSGAACTDNNGKVCDGNGACVECVADGDCTGGKVCDSSHACVAGSCMDNKKDGTETDVDCGGAGCSPCDNTKACTGNSDCKSAYCASNVCTACTADAQCGTNNYCETATGTCKATKTPGSTCGGASECASGFCVDGVCCDTACNGTCVACTAAKKQSGMGDGTCGTAKDGTDPHGTCPAQSPLVCGNTGVCTAGACQQVAMGTTCGTASCMNGSATPAPTCDGVGTCKPGTATSCGNFACNSMTNACYTNCMGSDANCATNFWCNTSICYMKAGVGGSCAQDNQCLSGMCNTANNKCK
jgi:hypothetical protein